MDRKNGGFKKRVHRETEQGGGQAQGEIIFSADKISGKTKYRY